MNLLKNKKWTVFIPIFAVLGLFLIGFCIGRANSFYLDLNIPDETIILEYGIDKMPDITGLRKGTLLNKNGTPVSITMDGTVDLQTLGTYPVTFSAKHNGKTLSTKRTFVVTDTTAPEITLVSSPEYYTNPSVGYIEEGFSASDNYDGDVSAKVVKEEKDGVVTYTVSDSAGNTATVQRKLLYKDSVPPTITLTKGTNISVNRGTTFKDPGFVATDDCDGDITAAVIVEGTVDMSTYGVYTLTYRVKDSSANSSEVKRTVKVADISAPVIKLNGSVSSYIKVGTVYEEPGFSASDNIDGNLTSKVQVTGSVNTGKMGVNTITYRVSDAYGNTTTATRSVFVYEKQAVSNPVNPGNKVVYLTFDDGPSKYTSKLLDILDKYGVKATFFVTNQFPSYQHMIGETYRRGHTIALHTYSHQYSQLYKSESAYYDDLAKINNIVVKQTGGFVPTIVRFPGGTSNTVSRNYCKGIMSSLTQTLSYHGYLYCDWNVSSADTANGANAKVVANNVISGIKKNNVSVVLQHDIYSYSVNAVEEILFWGIQNGYTFLPMSETTPMVHFKPKN